MGCVFVWVLIKAMCHMRAVQMCVRVFICTCELQHNKAQSLSVVFLTYRCVSLHVYTCVGMGVFTGKRISCTHVRAMDLLHECFLVFCS